MNHSQKPEEHFLSNGIPVILQHVDGPVGTFHWWNLTGSTDEQASEAGFAHFLEHMLFKDAGAKDTGQASTGQTARVIESLGGEINAYTTFDQTVYHVTCSEQYWEKVIDQFGIMAKPQKFLKDDFLREREVILEELRRGEDSPDRQLYQTLFSLTYKKHPYGKPVIGYPKVLKAATVQKLDAFYRRQYVSGEMGLVLVGPIKDANGARQKKLLSVLEKRFGKGTIPKRAGPEKKRPVEVASQKARFLAKHFDIKTPEFAFSFRIPDLNHPDAPLLEVLAGVLGMGESSRLHQKLFYEKAIVTDACASTYIPRDNGMFLFSAELKKTEDLKEVVAIMIEEIQKIASGDVRKEELDRIITNIESEKMYSTQTVDGVASRLGFLKYSIGDLRFDSEYLEQIKAVTPATLKRLAEEYLTHDRLSFVVFQPKGEKLYDFKTLAKDFEVLKPASEKKTLKTKVKKELLEPEIIVTPSGLKVAYFERVGTPVYSLYASAMGGSRSEITMDPKYWGASHLLSQIWAKGTPELNSKALSAIIEGSAASMDGFSGRNTIGLSGSGLTRDWDKLSNLFLDVLFNPSFADEELTHAKRVTIEGINSIPDHSSQVCSKLFMENLFTHHPYGKQPLGTVEQVEGLTRGDLQHLHQTWVNPKNMSLALVGGVSRSEAEKFILKMDSGLAKNKSTFQQAHLAPEAQLIASRWAAADFKREQTHIMVGGNGISMFDEDRYALRILQNILGGQSGRLFIELREKRSMAYTVSPMSMEGIETGYIGTYIACSPEKKDEATVGMRTVLENLMKKGPTASEMTRAKNYYLGQRAMDLQSSWSLASGFGLELLYREKVILEGEIRKQIERVTAKHVQKIGEKLFLDAPMLTVTVG
jgi:zinc protease